MVPCETACVNRPQDWGWHGVRKPGTGPVRRSLLGPTGRLIIFVTLARGCKGPFVSVAAPPDSE